MTRDEALNQKLAAAAVLRFLLAHGSSTLHELQRELKVFDRMTLLRGIALAESRCGLCSSISKKFFGATEDFSMVELPHTKKVLRILFRQIEFTHPDLLAAS